MEGRPFGILTTLPKPLPVLAGDMTFISSSTGVIGVEGGLCCMGSVCGERMVCCLAGWNRQLMKLATFGVLANSNGMVSGTRSSNHPQSIQGCYVNRL